MQYEKRVVCFIDLLGFAEQVRRTVRHDDSDDEKEIDSIAGAFAAIREILDIDKPEELRRKVVTQFSDSIVISFPVDDESGVFWSLLDVLWMQVQLIHRRMLCRGAVVIGKVVHTPQLLFGPAIVEAYLLESRAASYPRVILDESIIDLGAKVHARHHDPNMERESIMELLARDGDGMYYIDYVTRAQGELDDPEYDYPGYLSHLREITARGILNPDPSIRVKYLWLKEKLQPHLAAVKAAARSAPEGDDLREAYESIEEL